MCKIKLYSTAKNTYYTLQPYHRLSLNSDHLTCKYQHKLLAPLRLVDSESQVTMLVDCKITVINR